MRCQTKADGSFVRGSAECNHSLRTDDVPLLGRGDSVFDRRARLLASLPEYVVSNVSLAAMKTCCAPKTRFSEKGGRVTCDCVRALWRVCCVLGFSRSDLLATATARPAELARQAALGASERRPLPENAHCRSCFSSQHHILALRYF